MSTDFAPLSVLIVDDEAPARDRLRDQHRQLFEAIIERRAEAARDLSHQHIHYVQEVLAEAQQEVKRLERAQRRQGL